MMDWNDLQTQWQKPTTQAKVSRPGTSERLRQKVKRRDFLETSVALLMVPVFSLQAWRMFTDNNWVAFGFVMLIVLAMIGIPLQLWRTRRLAPTPDHQLAALDFLRAERRALTAQAGQLRYAWLWYFLPIGVGVTGMQFATLGVTTGTIVYAVIVALLGVVIDILNRRYAATKFQRMADAINHQIQALEEES